MQDKKDKDIIEDKDTDNNNLLEEKLLTYLNNEEKNIRKKGKRKRQCS